MSDLASADSGTQRADQTPLLADVGSTPMELRLPLPNGLDTGLETDALRCAFDGIGCVDNQPTYGVIDNELHQELLPHQVGRSASQHIHAHGGFYVAKEQFHTPTLAVEIGQFGSAITRRIQQRGDQVIAR